MNNKDWLLLSFSLYSMNSYEDCLEICKSLFPSFNEDAGFLLLYGDVLWLMGRLDDSFKICKYAQEKNLINASLIFNYSTLLIDLGKLDKAKHIFNQSVVSRMNPQANEARLRKIEALKKTPNPINKNYINEFKNTFDDPNEPLIVNANLQDEAMQSKNKSRILIIFCFVNYMN